VKNKTALIAAATGLLALFLVFAWLFWGSSVPDPTDKNKKNNDFATKATVHNTVLHRDEKGKKLWSLKVQEATHINENLILAKGLDGIVYLRNGDEMHVKAKSGRIKPQTNEFEISENVTARLKNGGFLKAAKVEWDQNKDILIATGAVKVVKGDMLAKAEKVVTSSKLKHFKLNTKAHVERGGRYEEN
jgi:LPS export ABC transporter protein LptC